MQNGKQTMAGFAVRLGPEDRLVLDALAMRLRVPRGEVLRRGLHLLLRETPGKATNRGGRPAGRSPTKGAAEA